MKLLLTEGGNVWDDVGPIKKEYVPGIIQQIQKIMPPGLSIIPHIGSAGFKVESGDMDVFVDAYKAMELFKVTDEKQVKVALKQYLEKKGFTCAQTGRNVHVKMPTPTGVPVQVDIMVIPNADKVAPFHQHGPTGQYTDPAFSGKHLQMMYSSLAKALNLKFSSFEGLLRRRDTNEVVADNKDAVAKILLNPKATAADLNSIKSILRALANDPQKDAKLAQARDDVAKGLMVIPESYVPGTATWFRSLAELVSPK
jgi:hypothetical protein